MLDGLKQLRMVLARKILNYPRDALEIFPIHHEVDVGIERFRKPLIT
jgi:hypothetical protein